VNVPSLRSILPVCPLAAGCVVALSVAAGFASSAAAKTIVKANNATALNINTAWITSTLPTTSDIALFNGTAVTIGTSGGVNGFLTGANLNLGQIALNITPGANGVNTQVNISNNTLNLSGVDGIGIDNSSYSGSNTGSATLQIASAVNAVNSQIWRTLNRQINITGAISGGSSVTIRKTGNGGLSLGSTNVNLTNPFAGTFVVAGGPSTTNFNSRFSALGNLSLLGGTSIVNFSNTASGFSASNLINATSTLTLGGGNLTVTGKASTANTQAFAGTTVAGGSSTILLTNQGAGSSVALNLGTITRTAGGLLSFTTGGAGTSTLTTSTGGTSGMLKSSNGLAYATIGSGTTTNWAAKDASSNIVNFAGYTTISGTTIGAANAGQDVNLTTTTAAVGISTVNLSTLRLDDTTATARTLTIGSGNVLSVGGILGLASQADVTFYQGTITAPAGTQELVVIVNGTKQLHFNSTISDNATGAVSLTTGGTGTTDIQTVNTYTGNTYVASGIHRIANSYAGNPNSTYIVAGNAALNINGQVATIGGLSGSGTVTLGNNGQMSVGANNADTVFDGVITSPTGLATTITKIGSGRLTLNGFSIFGTSGNYYTGTTTVDQGTLIVNGSLAQSANTIVNVGATIGGKGSISALTANGSSYISPGDGGIGTFTATTLSLNNSARFVFDLSATNNTSDLLSLSGALMADAASSIYLFDFTGGVAGQTYTLINFAGTNITDVAQFLATEGYAGNFTISGTSLQFQPTTVPPGSGFGAVPEPSTWLLLGLGLGVWVCWRPARSRRI